MNQEAIDQIKAERDSAWDLMGKAMDERDHFLKQRDEFAAENERLREDAARYRWLRHGDNDEEIIVPCTWTTTGYLPRNEELDAAIDAALTKEAANG